MNDFYPYPLWEMCCFLKSIRLETRNFCHFSPAKNQLEEKPRDHKITKSSSCKIKVCSYYKHKLYYKSPSVISLMIAFLLHARSMQELSLFNIKINIIFASCYRTFQINGAKYNSVVQKPHIIMTILMKEPIIVWRTTQSEGLIKLDSA